MGFSLEKANADYIRKLTAERVPCFDNLLTVLKGGKPPRPVLFELFMCGEIYGELSGYVPDWSSPDSCKVDMWMIDAFKNGGYDYFTLHSGFGFPIGEHKSSKSYSLNDTAMITDRESFERYPWPSADSMDSERLERLNSLIYPGMKAIPLAPGGILENVIGITGYDNLCFMLYDNPQLVEDIFNSVGEVLLGFYRKITKYPYIGAVFVNDDWGFNTQTMLSTSDMRRFVIPWHKRFVEVIHAAGLPAILHSCGQTKDVMDDIIDVIRFDAKHSYEDNIIPVEQAYDKWHDRIAIMGGIDLNFICTAGPEEVYRRSRAMLERSAGGGYALGTGNSVPYYVPPVNYYAMLLAALE
ncbi:MAG: uroporphyrinogen decarboxylase family protein [Eubacteriales bacterium]